MQHLAMCFASVLLLAAVASSARAQSTGNPPGTAAEQQAQLMAIESRIAQANRDCDYRYFAEVEASEFIFTDASGTLTTRAEDLAGESTCRKTRGTTTFDDVRVLLLGATAVVSARTVTTRATSDSTQVSRFNRFTDVFVWRKARWLLVAGHASRLPSPDAPRK
jgi:hypothetical protein